MMDLKRSYCDTSPPAGTTNVVPQNLPNMTPQTPQFLFSQQSTTQGVYAFQGAPAPATANVPAQSNGPVSPKKSTSKTNSLMKALKISSDTASASPNDAAVAPQPRRAPNASTTKKALPGGGSNNLGKTKKRSPKAAVPMSAPTTEVRAIPSQAGAPGATAAGPSGAGAPEQAAPPNRRVRPPRRRQKNKKEENDSKSNMPNHRIIITGFPVYTSERELVIAMKRHGLNPSIELVGGKAPLARATFTTDAEAYTALLASNKIDVNGHFVELKPYNEHYLKADVVDTSNKRKKNRRAFPKTKQKYEIVRPDELDLSGSFEQQLERVLASIRLTQEEVDRVQLLYRDLQDALRQEWPECVALPFGSITTGLGIKSSDADCFIALAGLDDQAQGQAHAHSNPVGRAKRLLQQRPDTFTEVLAIPRANTPIVKCYHLPTRTNCDVSFKTPLGVRNSRLLAHLLRSRPRLLPLAVLLKYWARVHRLSGSGRLTNYALALLLVFYLQQPPRRLLPPVTSLQRDPARQLPVDGWDTGFDDSRPPPAAPDATDAPDASVAELAGGFFEYYAAFPFHADVVCPYLGEALPKTAFHEPGRLPAEFDRYRRHVAEGGPGLRSASALCVQDPFEQCHNVTSGVPSRLFADIKEHFRFAAAAYRESRARGCDTFLRKILLEAPEAVGGKRFQTEYEVRLSEELVANLEADDWKAPLRDVVLTVFEKMLLVELTRAEPERRAPGREKYSGSVAKAIWKRKRGETYDVEDAGELVAREARLTEEIMRDDRPPVHVEFDVELRASDDPRRAAVLVRLKRGNMKAFKEFGRFLAYHDFWFVALLRPHLRRGARGGAAAGGAGSAGPPPDVPDSASDEELLDFDEDDENKMKMTGDDSADSKEESCGSDSGTDSAENGGGAPGPGGRH